MEMWMPSKNAKRVTDGTQHVTGNQIYININEQVHV